MIEKRQIVFVEHPNTTYTYKIARSLKLTGKYETVLITFSKVDPIFFNKAYDKIISFELSHKINLKSLLESPKKVMSKEFRGFLRKIKELTPFVFQVTGPDLFTAFILSILKNKPKIYFAYDIWAFNDKNFRYKRNQIKEVFQKKIEKFCFKRADGIIHKSAPESLGLLNYPIKKPVLIPGLLCLDEFVIAPKKKQKNKKTHLVYAGGPSAECKWKISFFKILRIITSQNIHIHTYGPCPNKKENELFIRESKKNKYFHMHDRINPENLIKELSKYDYGMSFEFLNGKIINPLLARTSIANKMFDYLEAGIPTLLGVPCEFSSKTVKQNKIGLCLEFKDLKNLKRILKRQNYRRVQEDIKKAQEKNRLSKKIKDFERFYELVAERHKKSQPKN